MAMQALELDFETSILSETASARDSYCVSRLLRTRTALVEFDAVDVLFEVLAELIDFRLRRLLYAHELRLAEVGRTVKGGQ